MTVIDILKREENFMSMIIKESSLLDANDFRRILISEIPTLAFDEFTINSNTSNIFNNDILKNRLELIPIILTDEQYDEYVNKKEEELIFELDVSHDDKELKDDILSITSDDFKCNHSLFLYPDIEVSRLVFGDSLSLEAKMSVGTGKTHAKFSPTGLVTFNFTVDDKTFHDDPNEIELTFESIGALNASLLFNLALEIMEQKGKWVDIEVKEVKKVRKPRAKKVKEVEDEVDEEEVKKVRKPRAKKVKEVEDEVDEEEVKKVRKPRAKKVKEVEEDEEEEVKKVRKPRAKKVKEVEEE